MPELLKRRPNAHVAIVGGDDVSYGARLPNGVTYKQALLAELHGQLDLSRVHFLGRIPYHDYLTLLHLSAVHVYLTYPFVLSWSLLESMSAGCAVVASRTQPVIEAITHEETGLLFDFFDRGALVDAVDRVLSRPCACEAAGYGGAQCGHRQVGSQPRLLAALVCAGGSGAGWHIPRVGRILPLSRDRRATGMYPPQDHPRYIRNNIDIPDEYL